MLSTLYAVDCVVVMEGWEPLGHQLCSSAPLEKSPQAPNHLILSGTTLFRYFHHQWCVRPVDLRTCRAVNASRNRLKHDCSWCPCPRDVGGHDHRTLSPQLPRVCMALSERSQVVTADALATFPSSFHSSRLFCP